MLIDPMEFLFALVVAFGIGFIAGTLWDHVWSRQPRDERGRFEKKD